MAHQKSSHNFTKIVLKQLRTKLFHIVLSAFFLTIGLPKVQGQELQNKILQIPPEKKADSLIINTETLLVPQDSVVQDSVKNTVKPALLEDKIKYRRRHLFI